MEEQVDKQARGEINETVKEEEYNEWNKREK